jgi:hypothetical protein
LGDAAKAKAAKGKRVAAVAVKNEGSSMAKHREPVSVKRYLSSEQDETRHKSIDIEIAPHVRYASIQREEEEEEECKRNLIGKVTSPQSLRPRMGASCDRALSHNRQAAP